ncbi:hypothetical protein HBI81_115510 [Parastagonospora nodorum]|nr:hypothetical protein HBH43_196590 [Parastagonospora nodorum]KAH4193416.1 hypothetical protein HBH42_100350 [Parastagonospora nodorum]KAH4260081.1 hypothetical protein HBI03_130680 [Parastagonospora nodorum]KAH4264096.1 hypothetical protein HBI04_191540 [Parastagonospora nodorum]KAH4290236.1 hypothetical protein HBI02_202810 [Parastagonospora nodorum]
MRRTKLPSREKMNSFYGTLRLLSREFAPCPLPRSSHTESCKWQLYVRHIHANHNLPNWNAAWIQRRWGTSIGWIMRVCLVELERIIREGWEWAVGSGVALRS